MHDGERKRRTGIVDVKMEVLSGVSYVKASQNCEMFEGKYD